MPASLELIREQDGPRGLSGVGASASGHAAQVLRDLALVQNDDPARRRDRLGPVRDDHPRQVELADRVVDLALALDVERAGRLRS